MVQLKNYFKVEVAPRHEAGVTQPWNRIFSVRFVGLRKLFVLFGASFIQPKRHFSPFVLTPVSITEILQENGDCGNGEKNEDKLDSEEDDEEISATGVAPTNDGFGVKKVRRGSSKKLETGLLNQIMGGETKSAKRA